MTFLHADWPAPAHIVAGVTTRAGENGIYGQNNLGLHVGDESQAVLQNRKALDEALPGEKYWQWLEQVHGVEVARAPVDGVPVADAAFTAVANTVCTVLTADCLPVLLTDDQGLEVAAVHAGWRSLCDGVIENAVACFTAPPGRLMAWLGPAIGPQAFEVGEDVRRAFQAGPAGRASMAAFNPAGRQGKYLCDIYQLARIRLQRLGVEAVYGGQLCTVSDKARFYSYRRDGVTGRMAGFIYRLQ